MKKKNIVLIAIYIFLNLLYYVHDANVSGISNSNQFIIFYIDSFNGFLYTTTILIFPELLFSQIDYKIPEINIRIKSKKFEYIWTQNIIIIIISELYIISCCFLLSKLYKFEISNLINFPFILRLFVFILFCFIIRELFYLFFRKRTLSTVILVIHNFIFLALMYSYNYYLLNNQLLMEDLLQILIIYETIICIFGLIYLNYKIEKKEYLNEKKYI